MMPFTLNYQRSHHLATILSYLSCLSCSVAIVNIVINHIIFTATIVLNKQLIFPFIVIVIEPKLKCFINIKVNC